MKNSQIDKALASARKICKIRKNPVLMNQSYRKSGIYSFYSRKLNWINHSNCLSREFLFNYIFYGLRSLELVGGLFIYSFLFLLTTFTIFMNSIYHLTMYGTYFHSHPNDKATLHYTVFKLISFFWSQIHFFLSSIYLSVTLPHIQFISFEHSNASQSQLT